MYFDAWSAIGGPFTEDMGDTQQPRNLSILDPWRDLQVGLVTAASLQASIRHADAKAVAFLTIEGAIAVASIDRTASLMATRNPVVLFLAGVLLILLGTGLVTATWQLVLAMRPQLGGARGDNRFGFPNLARSGRWPSGTTVRRQRDEAWEFVWALARIAMAKHRRVRRSTPWLVMSMASSAGLLIVATLAAPVVS